MAVEGLPLLLASAFAAGVVNSVAGGGTLLTFPALLLAGLDAKTANATSTVALWPGFVGAMWGFRRELSESRPSLLPLGGTALLGGALGAGLLIATPSRAFERIVPYLILFATALFTLQEPIARRLGLRSGPEAAGGLRAPAVLLLLLSGVYGGYFGAGNGIVLLAVLGLLGVADIHRANGLKAYLACVLNSVAAVGFAATGLVRWKEGLLMAAAAVAGGYIAARAARRVSPALVRRFVVLTGLAIAATLIWRMNP
jgi:uncharacterized membrane protein YfcA